MLRPWPLHGTLRLHNDDAKGQKTAQCTNLTFTSFCYIISSIQVTEFNGGVCYCKIVYLYTVWH